jgi:hypothetical protein
MAEAELVLQALFAAAENNSTAMVVAVLVGVAIIVAKQALEWAKVHWSRTDAAALERKEREKSDHDDIWKIYEETKVNLKTAQQEKQALMRMLQECTSFHIRAQAFYLASVTKIRSCIPQRDVRCPYPTCSVRQAFEANLDQALLEAQSKITEMFDAFFRKDRGPEA